MIKILRCDFNLCIYQNKRLCTLDSIDISSIGICDNAIIIELGEAELAKYKKELAEKINSYK